MITTRQLLQRSALLAIAALALTGSPALAQSYVFSDMGGLSTLDNPIATRAINNLGQVVGLQGPSAVQWNGSSWNTLALPAGYGAAGAYGINDFGQEVGTVSPLAADGTLVDAFNPVRWDNGIPTTLGGGNGYDFPGAINNSGQIAGMIWSNDHIFHPATWPAGGTAVTELPTLGGDWGYVYFNHSINEAGAVVGSTQLPGGDATHGTAWLGGVTYDLGTLGGTNSGATSINDAGEIVGNAMLAGDISRPVIWESVTAMPTDLGTLGGPSGLAVAINDSGLIAGWSDTADGASHLTLWDHGHIIDLTQFIPADLLAAGWQSLQGGINNSALSSDWLDLNNQGTVVSNLYDNDGHAIPILLTPTPVPVPAAVWLFGSGLAGLIGLRRKG
jgi:uncharacterized membrane protein